ncbi:hypothetical protein Tco_0631853 [Tanacetum coccineum]
MNDKMKDPECVKNKVKIAPHDYSKENYLATFTPQKQLTPEQIFWSKDLIKMKAKALKEQTTASRPLKALTVNFEELEAEVDQNVINRKHNEIKRKNLLIANDNLIVDCLSKEVFYIATNSELTVSRFTEMHVAHTIVQVRCLEHEAEFSKLLDRKFWKQHISTRSRCTCFGNKKSETSSDAPAFESVFVIGQLQEKLQGRGNTIRELKEKIYRLQAKHSDADPILDFKALDS